MSTIQQVNQAIMFNDWTNDELNSMIDAVKFKRASLAKFNKCTLRVGSDVKFTSTKRNQVITGKITKVAIKYATVATALGNWKVPMNMLEAA